MKNFITQAINKLWEINGPQEISLKLPNNLFKITNGYSVADIFESYDYETLEDCEKIIRDFITDNINFLLDNKDYHIDLTKGSGVLTLSICYYFDELEPALYHAIENDCVSVWDYTLEYNIITPELEEGESIQHLINWTVDDYEQYLNLIHAVKESDDEKKKK